MSASACDSIWRACRRGDSAYVAEFLDQEAERAAHAESETDRLIRTKKHKRGGATNRPTPDEGCGINGWNRSGLTPLHVSAIYQQRAIIQQLLSAGCSPDVVDLESGWTPLHSSLYRGDLLTAHVLRSRGADLYRSDANGDTPIDIVTAHQAEVTRRGADNGSGRSANKRLASSVLSSASSQSAFAVLTKAAVAADHAPTHNLLYSYGYQSNYTLGYTCDHYQHRPRLVDSCVSTSVVEVVALRQSVFILLSDGSVTSHGQGQSGKLGHQIKETLIEPKKIAALHDIVHIAGTDDYVCAVNAKGAVFIFGYSAFIDAAGTNPVKAASNSSASASAARSHGASHAADSSSASTAPGAIRYSQLPRRIDALRNISVAKVFPAASRMVLLTHGGELYFIGQSIEDSDRWESSPKRFAAPIHDEIIQVDNRDEFVAVLTTSGAIRIQRKGERKLNKLWLQNYMDSPRDSDKKSIRDLFPLIPPRQHVVRMSWSADGHRGAAVTREGQAFLWKLPLCDPKAGASSSTAVDSSRAFVYPRCIGYLVEGLAHVRVTDVGIARGHTSVLTEDGHVYSFGPAALGIVHPTDATAAAPNASNATSTLRPRRIMQLTQITKLFASDQYVFCFASILSPALMPSFPQLSGLYESGSSASSVTRRIGLGGSAQVPSLKLLCEHHIAQQITPMSVIGAYQWACSTDSSQLMHYCAQYLLQNLTFYLPSLLAIPDVGYLVYLQEQYALHYPLWFYSPSWSQPLQREVESASVESVATATATGASLSSCVGGLADDSFSFSKQLGGLSLAVPLVASSKPTEDRVSDIKLRRRALVKKLTQIAALEQQPKLDADQKEKITWRQRYEQQVAELDRELEALRDGGSVSAAQLWDRLHANDEGEAARKHHTGDATAAASDAPHIPAIDAAAAATVAAAAASPSVEPIRAISAELDRPLRAIGNKAPDAQRDQTQAHGKKGKQKQANISSVPPSSATPAATPIPTPTSPVAASRPTPPAATLWKSNATPTTTLTQPSTALHAGASSPVLSGFAAIQAEEARLAAAAAARASDLARYKKSNPALTNSASASLIPTGGKGWGAAAVTSGVSVPSSAASDFPTLALAQSPSFKPTAKPKLVAASTSSPPLRPSIASGGSAASISSSVSGPSHGGFSLADFLPPHVLTKAKPVTTKGWNTPTINETPTTQQQAGKNATKPSGAVPSESSSVSRAPMSLLDIQHAESLRCYGPAGDLKSQRDLSLDVSLGRLAWNTLHSVSAASQVGLVAVQDEERAAALAAAQREEARNRAKEKKKAKKAAAQIRDAEAEEIARAQAESIALAKSHPHPNANGNARTPKKSPAPKQKHKSNPPPHAPPNSSLPPFDPASSSSAASAPPDASAPPCQSQSQSRPNPNPTHTRHDNTNSRTRKQPNQANTRATPRKKTATNNNQNDTTTEHDERKTATPNGSN